MTVVTEFESSRATPGELGLGAGALALLLTIADVVAIAATCMLAGSFYHLWAYGSFDWPSRYVGIGILAGLLYALPALYRGEYQIQRLLDGSRSGRAAIQDWLHAFLALIVIGVLTKTATLFSRGSLVLFFACGLLCVAGMRRLVPRLVAFGLHAGYVASRRVMLVGSKDEIASTIQRLSPHRGVMVCAAIPIDLSSGDSMDASLARETVARARSLKPDDIVVLARLADHQAASALARQFLVLPAGLHVTTGDAFAQFHSARISRVGAETTICLTSPPIEPVQAVVKRVFDVVVAALALAVLSPVLLAMAAAIRLETPGPALFRQRRRGFNQQEFRIWKFRSMTTIEDGDAVRQATRGDVRITKVGAFLRKYNLDELPQLFNVLKGEMSIVGPRPHAVSHDQHYEERISAYPRRLNVRPGLTGWAQIHGLRGATPDDADMAARVDHDLYYIENWSLMLDLYIIVMTVLSPKAYRNAY